MPKQHYIIQTNDENKAHENHYYAAKGACCGAVCLTYLIAEFLQDDSESKGEEQNSSEEEKDKLLKIEKAIFEKCRNATEYILNQAGDINNPTNPLKIKSYLENKESLENLASLNQLNDSNKKLDFAKKKFMAEVLVWDKQQSEEEEKTTIEEAEQNMLTTLINRMIKDFNESNNGKAENASDSKAEDCIIHVKDSDKFKLEKNSFFIGVFANQPAKTLFANYQNEGETLKELHYILLASDGEKMKSINPHDNKWKDAEEPEITINFKINKSQEQSEGDKEAEWYFMKTGVKVTLEDSSDS